MQDSVSEVILVLVLWVWGGGGTPLGGSGGKDSNVRQFAKISGQLQWPLVGSRIFCWVHI